MKFRASVEDLKRGEVVGVGWHPVECVKAEELSDSDGAGLLRIHAKIIGGPNKDGVLRAQFSEKAQGMIRPFVEALTGAKFEAEKDYDVKDQHVRGHKMEWYVERGKYRGRDTNEVVDYRPLQA
jgi:hypothetical protein